MRDQYEIEVEHVDTTLIFFENWVDVDDSCCIFWISYGGPKIEAGGFRFSLKIERRRDKEAFLYEGATDCVSCDISYDDMKERKDGLILSKRVLEASVADDGYFHYYVRIFKEED